MPACDLSMQLPAGDGVHRLRLDDGRQRVCKRRRGMPASFFAAEVRGLEALRAAGGLRVPEVLALGSDYIVLEDLGSGRPGPGFHEAAGHGLAVQHARHASCVGFGFDGEGWCGDSPQDNTADRDGHRFFAQRRLLPQARRALAAGLLEAGDMRRIEALCSGLPELVPAMPPVLLHGDLWAGNLHCCADGTPALVDAGAVHHGWAEAELAMLVLFGAPPAAFFDAYAEAAPLARDWRERAPLYNLYHLLNHLNLFGAGYLAQVRAVLARW
jgi:fructosamine-3-kinase